jgi:hypothetical protein
MTLLRENYWAVEVPEDAIDFSISEWVEKNSTNDEDRVTVNWKSSSSNTWRALPPGTWQIICTTKDATYTHAQQIVEQQDNGFRNYNEDDFHYDLPLMSPFDSLRSLLEAKGLRGKNYCIIQKM